MVKLITIQSYALPALSANDHVHTGVCLPNPSPAASTHNSSSQRVQFLSFNSIVE